MPFFHCFSSYSEGFGLSEAIDVGPAVDPAIEAGPQPLTFRQIDSLGSVKILVLEAKLDR